MAKRQPTTTRASIHDVARAACVSAATVSKVMRGDTSVKPDNIARVNAAIEALDYRVDPMAADLRRGSRRILGVVVPDFESAFFSETVAALETLAEQRGFAVVATSSREAEDRERDIVARMWDWKVAGLILAPVAGAHSGGVGVAQGFGMRTVLIDRVLKHDSFDTVSSDAASAGAAIARELRHRSHNHVLVISLKDSATSLRARVEGFRAEARRLGGAVTVDVVQCCSDSEAIRQKLEEYFAGGHAPTAIYSLFLKATLVALAEIRRRGWDCPGQISLVGFDDAEWMQVTYPSVAAVVQPVHEIAVKAMNRLFARIEGDSSPPQHYLETCRIFMRDSVGSKAADAHSLGESRLPKPRTPQKETKTRNPRRPSAST